MPNLKTELLPHQKDCIKKIAGLKIGAFFMDMGTGKSLCYLELFNQKRNENKVSKLVVLLPIATKKNFEIEIEKHTAFILNRDVFLFGIDSISMSDRIYLEVNRIVDQRSMLIIDEATFIKNNNACRTKRAIQLSEKCVYKYIGTGTPITKHPEDLYSIFYFLSPKILGYNDFWAFRDVYSAHSERVKKTLRTRNIDILTQKISPYTFECEIVDILQMPKRIKRFKYYNVTKELDEEYQTTKFSILDDMEKQKEINSVLVFKLFIELQKVVSFDPCRLRFLLSIIKEIDESKNVIIWCKYTKEIERIVELLGKKNCSILNGEYKEQDVWIAKKTRFLVANLQTGAFGHNFQNCHYQVFYSVNFDWARKEQAERRCWRIGQKNNCVFVYLRSDTGIENLIYSCLDKKQNMNDLMVSLMKRFNKRGVEKWLRNI